MWRIKYYQCLREFPSCNSIAATWNVRLHIYIVRYIYIIKVSFLPAGHSCHLSPELKYCLQKKKTTRDIDNLIKSLQKTTRIIEHIYCTCKISMYELIYFHIFDSYMHGRSMERFRVVLNGKLCYDYLYLTFMIRLM